VPADKGPALGKTVMKDTIQPRFRPVILVLALGSLWAGAAPVPPPDKLLPADTLGVLTIPEAPRAQRESCQLPLCQLWNDPALKAFRDKFEGKFKSSIVEPLERQFNLKFADFAGLAQGQVTLALTSLSEEGKKEKPGLLLLVDAKDKSGDLKSKLAALRQKWTESGKTVRTEKVREVDFTVLSFAWDDIGQILDKAFPHPPEPGEKKKEEEKKPAEPKKLEWRIGQSDSLLIVGNSASDIEKVLIRQEQGALPSLSEEAGFAAQYGRLFRDAPFYGWFNLKILVAKFVKSSDEAPSEQALGTFKLSRILGALGLNGLQTLAINGQHTAEGTMLNFAISIPEANRQGIFKVLAISAKDALPPPFVPADAVKFQRWRVDLRKSWSTLEAMLIEINPQWGGVIKLVADNAGKDKDPNFDLRKSLIDNLGNDFITYEKSPRKLTVADVQSPPSLFLIGSPRPEKLAGALQVLASSLLPPQVSKMKEREFLGRKVYSLSLPSSMEAGPEKPADRALSFVASSGYVAISADTATLEEFLRNNADKPLREIPGLAAAAEKTGGTSTGLFIYSNQREDYRSAWEMLRKESDSAANLLRRSPLTGKLGVNENPKEWVDCALLPPFEQVAKYLYFYLWSGTLTADGVEIKAFWPTPPGN
jgi:hypothetical protein